MMLEGLRNGKTVTGSVILLAVTLLNALGVQSEAQDVAAVAGAVITVVGWIHKVIKGRKK